MLSGGAASSSLLCRCPVRLEWRKYPFLGYSNFPCFFVSCHFAFPLRCTTDRSICFLFGYLRTHRDRYGRTAAHKRERPGRSTPSTKYSVELLCRPRQTYFLCLRVSSSSLCILATHLPCRSQCSRALSPGCGSDPSDGTKCSTANSSGSWEYALR
jgi:hypothetical protein